MSYVTLPFRIRPSRARLGVLGGILAAVSVPIVFADLSVWPQVLAVLSEPSFTAPFAGAVALTLCGLIYLSFLIGFALVILPGAPFLHVDVDERGVTYRRLWHVTRVSFRDVDGWGYVPRVLLPMSVDVPIVTFLYAVVGGKGGYDGHLVKDNRRYAMDINVLPFTPLFETRASFAQDFAMCLTAAVRGVRASRRPITIDVAPGIAELAFPLTARPVSAPQRRPAPRKPRPAVARAPGRFPTNDDKAAYWRGQAFQAMRASDDSAAEATASEFAYFYEQRAKRDRKQAKRERREARQRVPETDGQGR